MRAIVLVVCLKRGECLGLGSAGVVAAFSSLNGIRDGLRFAGTGMSQQKRMGMAVYYMEEEDKSSKIRRMLLMSSRKTPYQLNFVGHRPFEFESAGSSVAVASTRVIAMPKSWTKCMFKTTV